MFFQLYEFKKENEYPNGLGREAQKFVNRWIRLDHIGTMTLHTATMQFLIMSHSLLWEFPFQPINLILFEHPPWNLFYA